MTAAVRATILVIAVLAGATVAAAIGILTSPAARGADDPQSFWRETAAKPHVRRIIMVTYRLHRRRGVEGARPDARETNKSQLGTRASVPGHRQALMSPSDVEEADSFVRRAVLPDPPRNIYVPPDLMQRDQPLQIFTPPKERKTPEDNRTRELCVAAVIVVAVLGSVASFLSIPERGIVHV